MVRAVMMPLLIPWFRLDPIDIPGPVDIQPFGILVATGILLGTRFAEWRGDQTHVPREAISSFFFFVIAIGFLSAMLLNMAFYEPAKLLLMFKGEFPYPGLSSFGGFFGGTMAAIYYRNRHRVSLMVLGDIFCFAFPLAWFFGRMGCFTVHDHPGLPSQFFLAVDDYYGQGIARHDLGLYEVIWSAVMVGLVLFLGRKPRPFGFFMALVPILYAPVRFGLDFLRESDANHGDVRYLGLTPGHYWAVLMLFAGIAVAVRVRAKAPTSLYLDGEPVAATPQTAEAPAAKSTAPRARASKGGKRKKR